MEEELTESEELERAGLERSLQARKTCQHLPFRSARSMRVDGSSVDRLGDVAWRGLAHMDEPESRVRLEFSGL